MIDVAELEKKYFTFKFSGVPFKFKDKTLIRAHRVEVDNLLHFYSCEEDFFWQANPYGTPSIENDVPSYFINKVN